MTYEQKTIARCTRNGHVLWQHVAAQMGVSVETARARHDRTFLRDFVPTPAKPAVRKPARARQMDTDAVDSALLRELVGSSRVDLQACKLEYSIVSPK